MLQATTSLARNAWRTRVRGESYLEPIITVVYITRLCNYTCSYCTEYGAHLNVQYKQDTMSTEEAKKVLSIVREGSEGLYFTGGEPLLRKDIVELVRYAKKELRFGAIGMNSNGSLLEQNAEVLQYLDGLVVSLDCMDEARADKLYKMPSGTTAKVIRALKKYSAGQHRVGYELIVNCVTGPDNVDDASAVFDFCLENGLEFSIQALEVEGKGPHPGLRGHAGFNALVERAIREKRKNISAVSGSETYLEGLKDMRPFNCYPTLNPRVDWRGRMFWPCQILNGQVEGKVDLLEHGSWDAAVAYARKTYGEPPTGCQKCYLRCYAELSLLHERPAAFGHVILQKLGQAVIRRSPIPERVKRRYDRLGRGA